MLIVVSIIIVIIYLLYILYKKKTKQNTFKKKVRFFGLPTEIDNIKPKFTSEPISNNKLHNSDISPINNLNKYIDNSVDF